MMRQTKQGFKIVKINDDGTLQSYLGGMGINSVCSYGIEMTTNRPIGCGPLAVFDCISDALKFLGEEGYHSTDLFYLQENIKLFKCKYKPSKARDNRLYYLQKDNQRVYSSTGIKEMKYADQVILIEEIPIKFIRVVTEEGRQKVVVKVKEGELKDE